MLKTIRDADIVPLGIGYYTAAEAARLLKTPSRKILRWLRGYSYLDAAGQKLQAAPLWRPQLPKLGDGLEIGFRDLIELRFVLAFLHHNVPFNVIRCCLENARVLVGEERPFSTHRFLTDGKRIFLESVREAPATNPGEDVSALVDLKTKQLVFKQVVEQTFKDLDIKDGSVVQWRPFGGKPSIVIDPARSFGKPLAADFGVPTSALAQAAEAEGSAKRAARLFEVPVSVVNDAVAFEQSLMAA
jgi:uncharacterized protein (DUF433 family)